MTNYDGNYKKGESLGGEEVMKKKTVGIGKGD